MVSVLLRSGLDCACRSATSCCGTASRVAAHVSSHAAPLLACGEGAGWRVALGRGKA
jgi:hypothetical protein